MTPIAKAVVIKGCGNEGVHALVNGLAIKEIERQENARREENTRREERISLLEKQRDEARMNTLRKYAEKPKDRFRFIRVAWEVFMAYGVIIGLWGREERRNAHQ